MSINLRDIITSLMDHNLAEFAYYDHEPHYHHSGRIKYELNGYDGNCELYNNWEPCLIFAGSGDYVGSTVDMANRRYVEQEYPELIENDHIVYHSQSYGYTALVIFFLRLPVLRSGLFDDLENLPDYCILDDELETVIEDELLEESWDNWLSYDFESEIENLTGLEFAETDWQRNLFWEILRNGNGSEYYPEGTSIYVDMEQVFKDSDSFVDLIKKNADKLNTGEFEISGNWSTTGYELALDWSYNGESFREDRQRVLDLHKNQKPDSIPENILKESGLRWRPISEFFWKVEPINKPLKDALETGITEIRPQTIFRPEHYDPCGNCHERFVMFVFYGDNRMMQVCPECYNKLMEYWPKCKHCQEKNVNASLQLSLWPSHEDASDLTHCQDCKNLLLNL